MSIILLFHEYNGKKAREFKMKPLFIVVLTAAAICSMTFRLRAQEARWVNIGPGGGTVTSVLEDPSDTSIVYLTTRAQGFWKSGDAGASWERKENGLPVRDINNVSLDPSETDRLYLGTARGVYRSTNGGASWEIASGGEMDTTGSFLVTVDPILPSRVFAASIGDKVYRSTNSGGTWTTASAGLPPLFWVDITVDPNVNTTLYLSSNANGVFRTANSGEFWEQKISGMSNTHVRSFLADPFSSNLVYAGTTSGGFFWSTDSGDLWSAAGLGLPPVDITSLVLLDSGAETIIAGTGGRGIFASTDGGDSFSPAAAPLSAHTVRCLAAPRSEKIYAGMETDGLFASGDGGLSWQLSTNGLRGISIGAFAASPEIPCRLYAAPSAGENDFLSRTAQEGAAWELREAGLPAPTSIHDLWLAPAPGSIFAATDSGVFTSTDAGLSWQPRNSGLSQTVSRIEGTPLDENLLYAVSSGLFKSTDLGLSWVPADSGIVGIPLCVLPSPTDTDTLYAGTKPVGQEGGGVYKSTDAGASWFAASSGIPALASVYSLDAHATSPGTIFAATESGIFRSSNGGETWFLRNVGVPLNFVPSDILIDASNPGRVLASSVTHGVYMSTNSGESWSARNDGLDTLSVTLLAQYEAGPDSFFAAASGQGMYLIDLSPTGVVEEDPGSSPLPRGIALFESFPNPFNPQTTILVSIGGEEAGMESGKPREFFLRVYDARGRLVRTLFEGALPAGQYRFTWDGMDEARARAASGSYFARLSDGEHSVTRKMVLIR